MSAILQDISEKLQKGKMKEVAELVKQAVADGIQPLTIINEGKPAQPFRFMGVKG